MDTVQIRQNLHNEETRLGAIRDDLRSANELDSNLQPEELCVVDNHPADIGSEQVQREVDLSILEQVEAELGDVERAMRKLDDGTYGKCEACDEEIAPERLVAQPATRFCNTHAQ